MAYEIGKGTANEECLKTIAMFFRRGRAVRIDICLLHRDFACLPFVMAVLDVGSLLHGLVIKQLERLKMPTYVQSRPSTSVQRGQVASQPLQQAKHNHATCLWPSRKQLTTALVT